MWKIVRIPAGNITNVHYNFVVALPLVYNYWIVINVKGIVSCFERKQFSREKGRYTRFEVDQISCNYLFYVLHGQQAASFV